MDLLKKNIHMDRIRCEAVTQITLEDDKNVPDSKPDVGSVNLEKARAVIEEVRPGTDSVELKGTLHFAILYDTAENEGGLELYEGNIPFEERVVLRGALPTDTVDGEVTVEDFSVEIINSRKLNIRSLLTISVSVEELYDEEAPIGIHGDGEKTDLLEYRRMPIRLAEIAICKNDMFRIRDEVTLPANYPNISRILWSTVWPGEVDFKLMSEKIALQGDLQVFILYEGEDEERSVRSYETTMPFAGMLDCHGCKEGMLPDIRFEAGQAEISVRPDMDGEERNIAVEMPLDIRIRIYEEEDTEILSDIYGVTREVETQTRHAELNRVRSCVTGKTKVADHIRIPGGSAGILQILHSEADVCQEKQSVVENGILLSGSVQVRVMYITGDDQKPYAKVEAQIPYQYTLEVPGIKPQDAGKVHAKVEQLQVTMLDGEEMDVKAVLCFSTVVFERVPMDLINQVTVKDLDSARMNSLPGMVIYVVKPGDSLWSIGRRYYVPVERIRELNGLTGDEIRPGQKLLLMRGQ